MVLLSSLLGGAMSQRALADSQHVTEQTIGRTVAHLESSGHLRRSSDPGDRRRRVVELTSAGRTLLEHLSDSGERLTDDLLVAAEVDPVVFRSGLIGLIDATVGGRPVTGGSPHPVGPPPAE
nr:MarR family transcriptional regulator [Nakamurella flavida]